MSYIVYVITVKPLGWTVRRKFEDFEWLRNYLVKQYPYMMVFLLSLPSTIMKCAVFI